jgi:hypothetical protein
MRLHKEGYNMSNNKKFTRFIAIAAIATIAIPGLAFAHNDDDKGKKEDRQERQEHRNDKRAEQTNEFGVRVFEDNGLHLGVSGLFYRGTVTAVSATGFTLKTKDNASLTVDASSAKIIRMPRTAILLTDIKVNDSVWITGTKVNGGITASVVYAMSENIKPAKANGTVTAVSGNTVTLQTKNDKTVTVTTTPDTNIVKADGTVGVNTDILVGSKLKIWGLWDKLTNILSALRIKIK